jgi:heat-inducible transcriptional repressor
MRHLDPRTAQDRKRRVLQWAVQYHIRTSRPIASSTVAEEAGLNLSSATIRSILSELEAEGFLAQPHTSSGRVPTDRGYRHFVDYLENVQRLAVAEKEEIERQYRSRVEELDRLLAHASRLLSTASRGAGLVLSPRMESEGLKRIDLIPLGGNRVLALVVTRAGQVRHWPIRLSFSPSDARVRLLSRFLNERVEGRSLREVRDVLESSLEDAERDIRELEQFTRSLAEEISSLESEDLFLEGAPSVVALAEDFSDFREAQSLARMLEERSRLAGLLHEQFSAEMDEARKGRRPGVRVLIGEETALPELRNLSLVTTAYRAGDRVVGLLGVLGSKRMEYSRVMSLVEHMGSVVSRSLEEWDVESEEPRD